MFQGWSYSWKCLMTAMRELAKGLTWRVGNGEMVDFWYEKWVPFGWWGPVNWWVATSWYQGIFLLGMWILCLSSGLCLENCWRVAPLPRHCDMPDRLIWSCTEDGIFTSKTAYIALLDMEEHGNYCRLEWLWKLKIPARWIYFLWG